VAKGLCRQTPIARMAIGSPREASASQDAELTRRVCRHRPFAAPQPPRRTVNRKT
jgi:hypothetical protein